MQNILRFCRPYPGFKKISGQELLERIKEHALEYGIEILEERVLEIRREKTQFKITAGDKGFISKTVLLATGKRIGKLEIPGEKEFTSKGVYYCGLCDGPLYKDKTIAVIGGNDSAAKEAIILSNYAKKIYTN